MCLLKMSRSECLWFPRVLWAGQRHPAKLQCSLLRANELRESAGSPTPTKTSGPRLHSEPGKAIALI